MMKERARIDINQIINYLKANNLTMEEAQEKINQINIVLKQSFELNKTKDKNRNFASKVFIISSFVLGVLITISSFIWGLI